MAARCQQAWAMLTTVYVLEIRQFTLVIALEGGTWLNQLFCLAKTCIEEDPATCSCCVELGTPHAFVRCLSTVAGGLLRAARVEKGMIERGTRTGPQRSEMPWRTAAGHLDNGCLLTRTKSLRTVVCRAQCLSLHGAADGVVRQQQLQSKKAGR